MRTKVASLTILVFASIMFLLGVLVVFSESVFGQSGGFYGGTGSQEQMFFMQGFQNQPNFLPLPNFPNVPQDTGQQMGIGGGFNPNQNQVQFAPPLGPTNQTQRQPLRLQNQPVTNQRQLDAGRAGSACLPSGECPPAPSLSPGVLGGVGKTVDSSKAVGSMDFYLTPKDYFDKFGVNLEEPKAIEGVYYKLTPEKMYFVRLSGVDINRVVCPTEVENVIYSEEKGIKVAISGRNVFIKYLMQKAGDEIEISRTPVDIYIVCGRKVYSMIAFPERIPGVLIYLEDKELELKRKLETSKGTYIENRIIDIIRSIFSGKPVEGANLKYVDRDINIFNEISIRERANYELDFEGLTIRYFEITSRSDKDIRLTERQFLHSKITTNPLALSLEKLVLKPGERTFLIVIERTSSRGQIHGLY